MIRLDLFLVNNNYFKSRNKAIYEIKNNNVLVNNNVVNKPSKLIDEESIIEIRNKLKYVSKGGLKLEKAINEFDINLKNKVMLDIGSSTGGFSDVAIQNNIKKIYAVDVGSNQFDKSLLKTNKVLLYENTDIRNFDLKNKDIDIAVIDVSFISVTKIIDKLKEIKDLKEIVCLIKPQFECGKEISDMYRGIPLNKDVHINVINKVINSFSMINFNIQNLTFSPIKGGSGNIEYLAYYTKNKNKNIDIKKIVNEAFY